MEIGDIQRFQMLDLNNISPPADAHHHCKCTVSPYNVRVRSLVKCMSSTGFSIKRSSISPSSNSSDLQEPPSKRLALCHPSAATAVGETDEIRNDADSTPLSTPVTLKPSPPSGANQNVLNQTLSDNNSCCTMGKEALNSQPGEFSNVNYAKTSPPSGSNQSVLNRTLSDNISCYTPGKEAFNSKPGEFPKVNYVKQSPHSDSNQNVLNRTLSDNISCYTRGKEALNSQPGEFSNVNYESPSPELAGTFQSHSPVLPRSISEPIPSDYLPTPSKTLIPSSSGSHPYSADSRRLRRMKERVKQMNQWMQKVANDDDEEDIINQETVDTNPNKMPEKVAQEFKPNQEAVVVEENGENLILHFKCPCGNGYEIIISGKKCYYRLM